MSNATAEHLTALRYDTENSSGIKTGYRRQQLESSLYAIYLEQQRKQLPRNLETKILELPTAWPMVIVASVMAFLITDALLSLMTLNMSGNTTQTLNRLISDPTLSMFFLVKSILVSSSLVFVGTYQYFDRLQKITGRQILLTSTLIYIIVILFQILIVFS